MRKLLDLQHPFFRPLWIRIATVAACLGWGALEWSWGNTFWALLFLVLGLICGWEFFMGEPPREPEDKDKDKG